MRITELLFITISIPPFEIERLLDALAGLPYHINPELRYEEWCTHVDFPAWRWWLGDLQQVLTRGGFDGARFRYRPAIDADPLPSREACRTENSRTIQLAR